MRLLLLLAIAAPILCHADLFCGEKSCANAATGQTPWPKEAIEADTLPVRILPLIQFRVPKPLKDLTQFAGGGGGNITLSYAAPNESEKIIFIGSYQAPKGIPNNGPTGKWSSLYLTTRKEIEVYWFRDESKELETYQAAIRNLASEARRSAFSPKKIDYVSLITTGLSEEEFLKVVATIEPFRIKDAPGMPSR